MCLYLTILIYIITGHSGWNGHGLINSSWAQDASNFHCIIMTPFDSGNDLLLKAIPFLEFKHQNPNTISTPSNSNVDSSKINSFNVWQDNCVPIKDSKFTIAGQQCFYCESVTSLINSYKKWDQQNSQRNKNSHSFFIYMVSHCDNNDQFIGDPSQNFHWGSDTQSSLLNTIYSIANKDKVGLHLTSCYSGDIIKKLLLTEIARKQKSLDINLLENLCIIASSAFNKLDRYQNYFDVYTTNYQVYDLYHNQSYGKNMEELFLSGPLRGLISSTPYELLGILKVMDYYEKKMSPTTNSNQTNNIVNDEFNFLRNLFFISEIIKNHLSQGKQNLSGPTQLPSPEYLNSIGLNTFSMDILKMCTIPDDEMLKALAEGKIEQMNNIYKRIKDKNFSDIFDFLSHNPSFMRSYYQTHQILVEDILGYGPKQEFVQHQLTNNALFILAKASLLLNNDSFKKHAGDMERRNGCRHFIFPDNTSSAVTSSASSYATSNVSSVAISTSSINKRTH